MSETARRALPPALQAWVEARSRHRLSHAHVQMARELGLNPRKLGSIANHDQEPWRHRWPSSSSICTASGSAGSAPRSSCRSSSAPDRWREAERKAARGARRAEDAVSDSPS